MNKARRKEIFQIIQKLTKLLQIIDVDELISQLENIIDDLQCVFDDEECVRDNIPENFQSGSRYEESENACDNMSDAISELEDIDEEYSYAEISTCISSVIETLYNCI